MIVENTITKQFLKKTSKAPHKRAIGWIEKGDLYFHSNEEYHHHVQTLYNALSECGLNPQDKVAILAQTCKEWHYFDLAALSGRAVVTPIYPTYLPHEVEFILKHSETKILFLENEEQLKKVLEGIKELVHLKVIISLFSISEKTLKELPTGIIFYDYQHFFEIGINQPNKENYLKFEDSIHSALPEDKASIIYTSGTTGTPKGAVISQEGFTSMLRNVLLAMKSNIGASDRSLTFLPLSHVFGRCDSMLNLIFDYECVYAESIDKVVDNLQIAKPTLLLAVPRIFEKVYSKILENIEKENKIKKAIFEWALNVSNDYFKKINEDKSPTPFEIIQKNLAYKLVFEKIYLKFGGHIRFLISGGAPISPEIIFFLQNANLTILEGYGLTETIAPCVLNPVVRQIPGTIGLPIGDVQLKFATDGEIMLKSKALFIEYYKNSEATKDAFQDEWFLTGDIGELTYEGYVKITDRKKDIIITSAGKNVAPQKIENLLKLQKHISNAMVVGDKRKFLIAVISLDIDSFKEHHTEFGLAESFEYKDLCHNSAVIKCIEEEMKTVNESLASFESLKGFILAREDFSIENGQMTPSLKLKKKAILKEYDEVINALYSKLESEK